MCNARSSKIKGRLYNSCAAFERDLALVVSNCRAYNEPESIYCTAATELETWAARLFEYLRNNDMLPPDDPTDSSDDDSSSSASSSEEDEDEGHTVGGNGMAETAHAAMNAGGTHANAAGWRQSAAEFLHDNPSGALTTENVVAGRGEIAIDMHDGSSSSSEDSSDNSDSSDDGSEGAHRGAWPAAPSGPSVATLHPPTGVVDHGLPRFTLGPKAASAPDHGGAPGW